MAMACRGILPSLPGFLIGVSGCLLLLAPALAAREECPLSVVQQGLKKAAPLAEKALVGLDFGEDGFGSGVIVAPEGIILTATHVSGGVGRPVSVVLSSGKRVRGRTLGVDARYDAAMVRIETPGPYDCVRLSGASPAKGDWVFALGHPGGYDAARGSVLRLGKVIDVAEGKIQTDCKLIGGDSGGPLFNMQGELIGIHSRVGQVLEDNVHVPAPLFQSRWKDLLAGKWVAEGEFLQKTPGILPVRLEESGGGLLVAEILPAEWSGDEPLAKGDLLQEWEGTPLKARGDLDSLLKKSHVGQKVTFSVKRDGKVIGVPVVLQPPAPGPEREDAVLPETGPKGGEEE